MPDDGLFDEPTEIGSSVSRLDARERILELLYEAELKDVPVSEVVAALPIPPDDFTLAATALIEAHKAEIDDDLIRVSKGWTLERMPVLDRSILRLGVAELCWMPDTPMAVVINEAVELAKQFSTEKSSRFINGVLSRLAADHRPTKGQSEPT